MEIFISNCFQFCSEIIRWFFVLIFIFPHKKRPESLTPIFIFYYKLSIGATVILCVAVVASVCVVGSSVVVVSVVVVVVGPSVVVSVVDSVVTAVVVASVVVEPLVM